jgi:cytochrome c oxidase assembly protein subunit 11
MTADTGENKNLKVATIVASVAVGMVGLAYASVPLYDLFCRVTGFGGTTQRADAAPATVLDRTIRIAFDANVNSGLGWEFKPVQRQQTVRIGEQSLAFYHATNVGKDPVTGTATFNVSPPQAGSYFSKIQCFCFTEQTLQPGQSIDMPVTYYVDPDIANDPDLKNLDTITLSYTFFKADKDAVQTSAVSGEASKDTVN